MKVLFLDDEIGRINEFSQKTGLTPHHVISVEQFFNALNKAYEENDPYDLIMLDHDLSDDRKYGTGNEAAKLIAENRIMVGEEKTVIIHSLNPIGVANMLATLKHCDNLRVFSVPWAWRKCGFDPEKGLTFCL